MDKSIIGDNPIQNYALIFYTLTEDTTIESNFACHYIYSYHFEPSNEVMQQHIRATKQIGKFDGFTVPVYTYLWKMTNPVSLNEFNFNQVVEQFINWATQQATKVDA